MKKYITPECDLLSLMSERIMEASGEQIENFGADPLVQDVQVW